MATATDEKQISWVGSSCDDLIAFPTATRKEAGFQLAKVQAGLDPTDWKPLMKWVSALGKSTSVTPSASFA